MFVCPGFTTCIIPPQLHISFEELFSAGKFPIITVGDPGAQGATVKGMHGMGVKTPNAAAVAEATVGFASDWHIPNGAILSIGLLSIIVANGIEVTTLFSGSTMSVPGAKPKLH